MKRRIQITVLLVAIIKHTDSTIAAYDIQGDEIEYQAGTQCA